MPETNREEIAKLEALYANNPGGRVFTHLAEAYRKAGELDKARTILEQGISRHDDYASAHVVLGRVLQDQGDLAAAANAFRRVIQLDPDNRIALRTLGDLANNQGQVGEALEHYRHLRTLDPGDDELEQLVGELTRQLDAVAPAAPTPVPDSEPDTEPEPIGVPLQETEPLTFESAVSDAPELEPITADFSLETWDVGGDDEGEGLPGDLGALATFDVPAPDPSAEVSAEAETLEAFELPEQELPPLPEIDFGAEFVPEEATAEPTVEDLSPVDFSIDPAAEEAGSPVTAQAEPTFEAMLSSNQPQSATEPEATPEDLPTETLAELYRGQGFPERAAEVYRALLQQRPGDQALTAKLQELESGEAAAAWATGPESPPAPLEEAEVESHAAWAAAPPGPAGAPSPWDLQEDAPEEDAGGSSVSEYLRGLLGWRPSRTVSMTGVQTGSVLDHDDDSPHELVLDQVETVGILETEPPPEPIAALVLEAPPEPGPAVPAWEPAPPAPAVAPPAPEAWEAWEAPAAEEATAAAPAPIPAPTPAAAAAYEPDPWEAPGAAAPQAPPAPPTPPAAAAPVIGNTADEAFDSWFGADETPAAPAPTASAPQNAEAGEESAEGDDDLEMFRSWLQSLKK